MLRLILNKRGMVPWRVYLGNIGHIIHLFITIDTPRDIRRWVASRSAGHVEWDPNIAVRELKRRRRGSHNAVWKIIVTFPERRQGWRVFEDLIFNFLDDKNQILKTLHNRVSICSTIRCFFTNYIEMVLLRNIKIATITFQHRNILQLPWTKTRFPRYRPPSEGLVRYYKLNIRTQKQGKQLC